MNPVVLLVATATRWVGAARIPAALAKAGFTVALLAPKDALIGKSRFVAKMGHLPDGAASSDWVYAMAAMVKATAPRLVLPCDEMSIRLLQMLVLAPPATLQPGVRLALAALVSGSLGDPQHFQTSVDKTLLPTAAAALGVRMPTHAVVTDLQGATAFATAQGYPVVLKRAHGAAGEGVAIVHDHEALAPAFGHLSAATALDLADAGGKRLLAQAFVPGPIVSRSAVAWDGHELAGVTREKLRRHPPEKGPGTVMRYYCDPEARAFSEALTAGLGLSGFHGFEYVVHERTGELHLLEINRRVTPGSHTGALVGIDLCAALHAAVTGAPSIVPHDVAPGFQRIVARFPQEWLRDPASPYLRDYPVDAPWDDPELFEALLAMRHDV